MSDLQSTSQGRYVDLTIDVAFKRVFSQPANKDLLMALLSVVLPELSIKDLTYLDKERVGSADGDKKSVFDVLCETSAGEEVLIEIQLNPQKFFRDRTLYYSAQEILWQHKSGDEVYTLKPVYVVSFLDFCLKHEVERDGKFVWRYSLCEPSTGELMTNALKFTYIELPKFNKTEKELVTLEDKFYFCMTHMSKLSKRPGNLSEKIFEKLFEVAQFAKMSRDDQRKYTAKMTTERDIRNQIAYAREEGVAQGFAEGEAKGIAKGLAEGEARGERLKSLAIAKAMKANGLSVDMIVACTQLPPDEIAVL